MLESLRLGVKSWYFKTLLILLACSFAVFGIGDITPSGPGQGAIVSVGDIEISGPEVYRAFQRRLNEVSRQLQTPVTVEQAQQLGIDSQVVDALSSAALYDVEAKELGVAIGDETVRTRILSEPSFRNELGQFDRGVFEQLLASNGMTEAEFVDRVRREIARDQVLGSLAGGLPESKQLSSRLFQWRNERRVAEYIVLKSDPTLAIPLPDDGELKKFHADNAAQFTAPDYRKVSLVYLSADSVKEEAKATDDALRSAYESRLGEFHVGERRDVQQMILPDEETAKKAAGMLNEGREFVALAEQLAKQDPKATNLGEITRSDLTADLVDGVFSLVKGETSKPIKGPFGWYLMRVQDIKPEGTRPFEEVRERIRRDLEAERSIELLTGLSVELEDALGGGASLSETANRIGAKFVSVPAIDRRGQGPDGNPIIGVPPELAQHAFNTPVGEQSSLIELSDTDYIVVNVESETPSALRPFETIREEVVNAWKSMHRRDNLERKAGDIVKRIDQGTSLQDIAGELNLVLPARSAPFTRNGEGAGSDIPRALVAQLFALKIGKAASAANGSAFTVAVLKEIKKADPVSDKAARDSVNAGLTDAMTRDVINQFNSALRDRHSVEVNQRALNNLFLQN